MSAAWCRHNAVSFLAACVPRGGREGPKWRPGSAVSVRRGWDPLRRQRHSARSRGAAALTPPPTEFRRVTGRPVGEAVDCHPASGDLVLSEESLRIWTAVFDSRFAVDSRSTKADGKMSLNGFSASQMRRSQKKSWER